MLGSQRIRYASKEQSNGGVFPHRKNNISTTFFRVARTGAQRNPSLGAFHIRASDEAVKITRQHSIHNGGQAVKKLSLLLALLSLIFLLKISPGGREPPPPTVGLAVEGYDIIYDVTLALSVISLSLNLCCLLVCAIQFLFAVKLVRAPATTGGRGNKYLQKSSVSRVCAVGGFFISIPIFLTGIILYTFTQFHSTPAIVTSILIGVGIVFCGGAMVHNVFVWQREKTISVRQSPLNLNLTLSPQISTISHPTQYLHQNGHANHSVLNHSHAHNHNHTPVTQLTPVTPLSGNHSHISFNHSYLPSYGGIRAATATPPTPKVNALLGRDASGSVSPGMPVNLNATVLDISNVTATNSPHELSTLV